MKTYPISAPALTRPVPQSLSRCAVKESVTIVAQEVRAEVVDGMLSEGGLDRATHLARVRIADAHAWHAAMAKCFALGIVR